MNPDFLRTYDWFLQNTNKKGFTTFIRCKSLISMVGTIGFEPTTSTVSRLNVMINELILKIIIIYLFGYILNVYPEFY